MTGDDLVGAMFLTAKDLRHLAEQEFDELFVPTEVLVEGASHAVFALQPRSLGRVLVHAERERPYHPFRITRLELAPEVRTDASPAARARTVRDPAPHARRA